jgi:transforming growth factor-beta-induced protein
MKAASFALILGVLTSAMPSIAASSDKDIVDTAVAAGSFHTLVAALQAAGLADTLKGKGPFTVFAPTDDAFEKLPAGTVETLLKPENKEKLKAILLYHVVAGDVTASQAMKTTSVTTLNGQKLALMASAGTLMVNDAKVVKADISTSNGVIHVIDAVLLPKN